MQDKTYKSAIVLIPPKESWDSIQGIRREYDSKEKRWMPHITLFYPFWPKEEFVHAKSLLEQPLSTFPSFTITLREIYYFSHGLQNYTLWLGPEPKGKIIELYHTVSGILSFSQKGEEERFNPHLTLGQVHGKERLQQVCSRIREYWQSVSFSVDRISLIWREDTPNDTFQVAEEIFLGKASPESPTGIL